MLMISSKEVSGELKQIGPKIYLLKIKSIRQSDYEVTNMPYTSDCDEILFYRNVIDKKPMIEVTNLDKLAPGFSYFYQRLEHTIGCHKILIMPTYYWYDN